VSHQVATCAFSVNSGKSWHGLEKFLFNHQEENVTSVVRKIGADFEYFVLTPHYNLPSGKTVPSEYKGIFRTATSWDNEEREIRTGVKNTEPINPLTIAEILNPLTEKYELSGVIVLKQGSIFIVTMQVPEFYVRDMPNEGHKIYFNVSQDLGSPVAVAYGTTFIRVVCWNTWTQWLNNKDGVETISHASENIEMAMRVMAKNEQAMIAKIDAEKQFLDKLFGVNVSKSQSDKLIEALFPMPQKPKSVRTAEKVIELSPDLSFSEQEYVDNNLLRGMSQFNAQKQMAVNKRLQTVINYANYQAEHDYGSAAYWLFNAATDTVNNGGKHVNFKGDYVSHDISRMFGGAKNQELARIRNVFDEVVK
jgi:hypothetical protein